MSRPGEHEYYMDLALRQAALAASEGEVPVGAVIIQNGEVIGVGRNRREQDQNALAHAEIEAIRMACKAVSSWRLSDTVLYVTLEPCPMCMGAAINARIPLIVYGAHDPKAGCCGSLTDLAALSFNHRPNIRSGIREAECAELLRDFFRNLRNAEKG